MGLVGKDPAFSTGFMPDSIPLRLEVSHLTRAFGGRPVVDDVSLSVAAGQVTCLLGPSGCGKSTTLRMIAGVERAESGEIRIDGRQVAGLRPRVGGIEARAFDERMKHLPEAPTQASQLPERGAIG